MAECFTVDLTKKATGYTEAAKRKILSTDDVAAAAAREARMQFLVSEDAALATSLLPQACVNKDIFAQVGHLPSTAKSELLPPLPLVTGKAGVVQASACMVVQPHYILCAATFTAQGHLQGSMFTFATMLLNWLN